MNPGQIVDRAVHAFVIADMAQMIAELRTAIDIGKSTLHLGEAASRAAVTSEFYARLAVWVGHRFDAVYLIDAARHQIAHQLPTLN